MIWLGVFQGFAVSVAGDPDVDSDVFGGGAGVVAGWGSGGVFEG